MYRREITKDIYDRTIRNYGYITIGDQIALFSHDELHKNGIYSPTVKKEGDKYYVLFSYGKEN